jgi:hypothetical protein
VAGAAPILTIAARPLSPLNGDPASIDGFSNTHCRRRTQRLAQLGTPAAYPRAKFSPADLILILTAAPARRFTPEGFFGRIATK